MNQSSKLTLTVGIPAFNEAQTIQHAVTGILAQTANYYALKKIIVLCDGCSDGTADRVRELNLPLVTVVNDPIRKGKIARLEELYALNTSDILLTIDADVTPSDRETIDTMVKPFIHDTSALLVAANTLPYRANTFLTKVFWTYTNLWDRTRVLLNKTCGGDNIHNVSGAATALRRDFAASIKFPDKRQCDNGFLYICATRRNGFRYAESAIVWYRLPETMHDFRLQVSRAMYDDKKLLLEHFGNEILPLYQVPTSAKRRAVYESCILHPWYTACASMLGIGIRAIGKEDPVRKNGFWQIAETTKKPIPQSYLTSQKKNVIIFSNYDDIKNPYYAGGGSHAIHQVAKRLAPFYAITVFTGRFPGSSDCERDGVTYRRIGLSILGPRLSQLIFALVLPWYAHRETYDLWIESFTPPFTSSFLQLFTRKRVIALVHMLSGADMRRKYKLPFEWVERAGIRSYRNFIVMSDSVKETITRINPKASIIEIPNGVDIPRDHRHPTTAQQPYILYLGRIEINQKGLDLLVNGYAHIHEKMPLDLIIAGAGTKREERKLMHLIDSHNLRHRIHVLGRITGSQKDDVLRNAAFVTIPSRFETFSLVALEAVAHQLPLISFDIDGLRWLPQSFVMKVPAFDQVQFSEMLYMLATNRDLQKKLSKKSFEFLQQHNWSIVADQYKQTIDSLLYESAESH